MGSLQPISRLLVRTGVLLAALAGLAAPVTASADVGDVPPGKTLVVIGQSGSQPAQALAAATDTRPAGAMWYLNLFDDADALDRSFAEIRRAVQRRPGLVVQLGISFGSISTPSRAYTADIAAGRYDGNIRRLAAFLNELPTIAYLRIGYEFDLLRGQYGPPGLYKKAFRRVVDRLRKHRVDNANYVWHSAGAFWRSGDLSMFGEFGEQLAPLLRQFELEIPRRTPSIAAFHPGRRYVDAFGISYWQDRCCFGRSSPRLRQAYEARTRSLLRQARGLGLPLHISESTPANVGATSGRASVDWLNRYFRLIEDFDIRMLSLISVNWLEGGFFAAPFWNGYWPDARVHRYRTTCNRYVAAVGAKRYIHRSRNLGRRLSAGSRHIPDGPRPGRDACRGARG